MAIFKLLQRQQMPKELREFTIPVRVTADFHGTIRDRRLHAERLIEDINKILQERSSEVHGAQLYRAPGEVTVTSQPG